MSQKLSDTIAKKKKQLEEEAERDRVEREKKKQEHDEKLKKERERQQEKLRRLNTSESLGIECKCAVTNPLLTSLGDPSPKKHDLALNKLALHLARKDAMQSSVQ